MRKKKLHRSTTEFNEIIHETLRMLELEIRGSKVLIHLKLAENLPLVIVDRVELQQVVMNLVRNGLDSMVDSKHIEQRMTITTTENADGCITVAISDQGNGLLPDDVKRIFEPFFSTKVDGLGMGLAICRTLVEAHGGRLWATPNEDRGAIFTFSIPTGRATHVNANR